MAAGEMPDFCHQFRGVDQIEALIRPCDQLFGIGLLEVVDFEPVSVDKVATQIRLAYVGEKVKTGK